MNLIVGRISRRDMEDFQYTLEMALKSTEFWREKFSGIDPNGMNVEKLAELTETVKITPHDLYKVEEVWPDYIHKAQVFYTVMRTSGTTGKPKRIPYTRDDRFRTARQVEPWIRKYMDNGDRIASFFPPLPSSSGMFAFGAFEAINAKSAYYQIPIQYLLDKEMLLKELQDIKPTAIFCLTATAYNLGLILPESIKKDIQTIVVGGETLTPELARATLELFENAVIIDNFGSTEDAITGYRVITKKKTTEFHFEESVVILKDNGDGYDEYKRIYITKVMRNGELTGLPLFNYDIGDLARVVDGEVRNIIRVKDVISLAGAKLHIDQVMEIVFDHPDLLDFVIIYHPLSPKNPKPKAIIRVAYSGEKPAGIEDEVRELIYGANNPVRYEVEESKQAELTIEAVPLEKLKEGLPRKLGKTKRIYIVGKDL
ncbi:long-chain fatty acid--CoA ligase [Thermococcus sp. LS1]|uniref:phenylacetate--CoA ligase family protein n=1 Tax=Thermococcus sp. LS1 TaxID=1638259 RepID=UPI00143ACF9A|nr:AMP-binding protein [Thermococcus sp. LS1]NJD99552.1 long-chain fatty acid--CoA ligase [Thermococcus sp. LS1]